MLSYEVYENLLLLDRNHSSSFHLSFPCTVFLRCWVWTANRQRRRSSSDGGSSSSSNCSLFETRAQAAISAPKRDYAVVMFSFPAAGVRLNRISKINRRFKQAGGTAMAAPAAPILRTLLANSSLPPSRYPRHRTSLRQNCRIL